MDKYIKFLLFTIVSVFTISSHAQDLTNGQPLRDIIILGGTHKPTHLVDFVDPVAMYTISTATIDITFDANYYSEYTIHLVGEYVEMDYFVYTPVVYIPVATFGEIIDIYIESEDCGCYYGTLDQSAYINTYKTN